MANNHIVDPTFFYQAIEMFSFDYHLYRVANITQDEQFRQVAAYEHHVVSGSLQSEGKKVIQSKDGNRTEVRYGFYCKSLYRINEGDIIRYNNRLLRVNEVSEEYDEWGVRVAKLIMVQLSDYRDLLDYIKYIEGIELV